MAKLLRSLNNQLSEYKDRRFDGTLEQFQHCLRTSTTVYVGNLSFYTTEEQIHEVFSKVGDIRRIIMGLDKHQRTPCGFCFVVYYTRGDTEDCVKYLNGIKLDDRPIRVDFDWGFREGRQFGRGRSGGQVRDEYRMDYDAGRGGFGKIVQQELQARMYASQMEGLGDQDQADERPTKRRRRDSGDGDGDGNDPGEEPPQEEAPPGEVEFTQVDNSAVEEDPKPEETAA